MQELPIWVNTDSNKTDEESNNSSVAVSGFIMEADGTPVTGAELTIFKDNTLQEQDPIPTSNADGSYTINLGSNSTYTLIVNRFGYATQVESLKTIDTPEFTLDILMVAAGESEFFDPPGDFTATGASGASVVFSADSFDKPSNDEIEVTITPLDISTQDGVDAIPGGSDGEFVNQANPSQLYLLGLAEFTFFNSASEDRDKIDLIPGQSATVTIPVFKLSKGDGTSYITGETVPLLYLDETTGLWIQEGLATIVVDNTSPTGFAAVGEVRISPGGVLVLVFHRVVTTSHLPLYLTPL